MEPSVSSVRMMKKEEKYSPRGMDLDEEEGESVLQERKKKDMLMNLSKSAIRRNNR